MEVNQPCNGDVIGYITNLSTVQNPCWLMTARGFNFLYIGEYHDPLREPLYLEISTNGVGILSGGN